MPGFSRRRRRKKRTKSENQRIHAKRRARERYGICLVRRDLDKMVASIQSRNGAAEIVRKVNNRISTWLVTYKGIDLPAVYDCHRHNIVTFLPKERLVEFQLIVEGRKFEEDG